MGNDIIARFDPGGTYLGGKDASFVNRLDPGGYVTGVNNSSGGKKGGGNSAPQYTPPPSKQEPAFDMEAMMGMMMAMSQMSQTNNQPPPQLEAPQQSKYSQTDWTQRKKDLQEKLQGTVKTDLAKKNGRSSTVITDPLSSEDITTTKSVLT